MAKLKVSKDSAKSRLQEIRDDLEMKELRIQELETDLARKEDHLLQKDDTIASLKLKLEDYEDYEERESYDEDDDHRSYEDMNDYDEQSVEELSIEEIIEGSDPEDIELITPREKSVSFGCNAKCFDPSFLFGDGKIQISNWGGAVLLKNQDQRNIFVFSTIKRVSRYVRLK